MAHLEISIPATTEVVGRGPGLAAYLKGQEALAVDSLVRTVDGRVEIEVDEAHGLAVGDQVIIDGVLPTGATPVVDAGTPSEDFVAPDDSQAGTTDTSLRSVTSLAGTYEGIYQKSIRDPSGRVIIVGGATTPDSIVFTPKDNLTAFEVTGESDSVDGRTIDYLWTQVASDGAHGLSTPNFGYRNFGISLLVDGRILCTGGAQGDDLSTPVGGWDMLQFLPPDSVSQQSGLLPDPRSSHAQASLNLNNGGGAVICGGWTDPGVALDTALGFNVTTLTWNSLAPMFHVRMHHQLIGGSQPLAIGGQIDDSAALVLNTCELYHPFGDIWTKTGNMTYARTQFGAIELPNGNVLVVGGYGYNPTRGNAGSILATCEVYDRATELWSNIGDMPGGVRIFPIVQYLASQNVVIVTGGGATNIDILDLTTMKWKKSLASMGSNLVFSTGGIAADDVLLVCGGSSSGVTDTINYIVVPGAETMWLGQGLNGHFRVDEVPDATHIVVNTTEYDIGDTYNAARAGATVTPKAAEAAPTGIPGPFSYDTKTGFAITSTAAATAQEFNEGGHYAVLALDDTIDSEPALQFPDEEGYLVLQFGYKNVVGPIRYFGRLSDTELILDAGSVWQASLPVGATVRLLSSRLPFSSSSPEVGNFYATGTAAGRVAAQKTIDDIIAAGKQIKVSVIYPGDIGLGGAGFPQSDSYKLSDKVAVWGGDDLDQEIPAARKGQS